MRPNTERCDLVCWTAKLADGPTERKDDGRPFSSRAIRADGSAIRASTGLTEKLVQRPDIDRLKTARADLDFE
jgi:hypothetical protein